MSTARGKGVKLVKKKDTWLGTLSSANEKSVMIVGTLSFLVSFLYNSTTFQPWATKTRISPGGVGHGVAFTLT